MRNFFLQPVIFILLIAFCFLSLRLYNLTGAVNYGSDAARDFLVTRNMYITKHPVLIGPPSEYSFNGRQFFFGPAPYYLILPSLVLGHWDPLSVSYFTIFLNLVVLLFSLIILMRSIKDKSVVYYFALLCTFTPAVITYEQSYWNPYFMLPVSTLLVALIVKSNNKKNINQLLFIIGILFGLGLQFHYSFLLAIIVSCFWLFYNKNTKIHSLVLLLAGFIIGFLPIILFELRNHFYNLNTIFLILTHPTSTSTSFIFNIYYFISLLPFILYWLSILLTKLSRVSRLFVYSFFVIVIFYSLVTDFSPHVYALSYPEAKEIAQKIVQDKPKDFNIVDQLTGDNRGTSIRYLLTVQGNMPQGVIEYGNVRTLYIYSKVPLKDLLKVPVWEIKTFLPFSKAKKFTVSNNIYIYRLEK